MTHATNKEKIRIHQITGRWVAMSSDFHCVKIRCDKCKKQYHINSGLAIAKHEIKCNRI